MPNQPADRLYIIDGHALIFRMYYAFIRRPMINSKGADMSVLFGFTKYLLELVRRCSPTHLAVVFDPPGGSFRNRMYPQYKANRKETPQLIIDALEPLTELCQAMNIPVFTIPGYEADDVAGTLARKFAAPGMDVFLVTPDKDYGQLVGGHIFQVKPGKDGDEVYDSAAVCAKYGISDTSQVIEMLALCGDASDNVPGVNGIGEVGATKLLSKYGTVENILAHLDELTPRQKSQFEAALPHLGLSHDLVTIRTDVPVDTSADRLVFNPDFQPLLYDLFEKYEFKSLRHFLPERKKDGTSKAQSSVLNTAKSSFSKVYDAAKDDGKAGICLGADGCIAIAALSHGNPITASGAPEHLRNLLEDKDITKCSFDIKAILKALYPKGVRLSGVFADISLMHYVTDPEKSHSPEDLAMAILGLDISDTQQAPSDLFSEDTATPDACEKTAAAALMLYPPVLDGLKAAGAEVLYSSIEAPLIPVLARMEAAGVKVNPSVLKEFADSLRVQASQIEREIRSTAEDPSFNVSSPRQVGELLFGRLALDPKAKKTSRGAYPTDEETLAAISDRHPVVEQILRFRGIKKLLSTYIDPLPSYINPSTGKIHTTFNQALTATGRLSSSNPNLQNIPIRTEQGKEIRKAFVPSFRDGVIVSADYSQIELRIMAHLSGDAHMTRAFRAGTDVHSLTAAKIYGIDPEDVTPEQRRIAKTANFGIIYGISSFGLAQRLGISRKEASALIDDYFEAFPTIRSYIDKTAEEAASKGYVETLFGRRRYLPDIKSSNATLRALARRNAVNAPIQGTAADIIKMAMIEVDRRLSEEGLRSILALQIHDELMFDCPPEESDAVMKLAKETMEGVITLSIPLTVSCNYGKNWLEAH